MEQQSFREFISGLSDREARKWSLPEAQSAKVQRGARMPGQRRAGKLVYIYIYIYIYILYQKLLETEKEMVHEVARGDKPYLGKSIYTDRKAQIRKAFVQFSGLICALRSADSLR